MSRAGREALRTGEPLARQRYLLAWGLVQEGGAAGWGGACSGAAPAPGAQSSLRPGPALLSDRALGRSLLKTLIA